MIHDLKGEDHMSPAVGMLFAMVKENWTRLESITLEQYGPMIGKDNKLPFIEGVSRDTLISQHHLVMTMLQQTCTLLTDEDLNTVLAFGHENEKQASVRWALWHMADHNRYHQAHINQLRKWYKSDPSNR